MEDSPVWFVRMGKVANNLQAGIENTPDTVAHYFEESFGVPQKDQPTTSLITIRMDKQQQDKGIESPVVIDNVSPATTPIPLLSQSPYNISQFSPSQHQNH